MRKTKKGSLIPDTSILLILGVFVLIGMSVFFFKTINASDDDLNSCPVECTLGECSLNDLPKPLSTSCSHAGVKYGKEYKCCIPKDLITGKNTTNTTNLTSSGEQIGKGVGIIQIRLGESESAISHRSSQVLKITEPRKTYTYYFWGEKDNASTCSVQILDKDTKQPVIIPGLSQKLTKVPCKEEKNKISMSFTPSKAMQGSYLMDVRLYDTRGDRIAWSEVLLQIIDQTSQVPNQ